jgi:hypothetical protein
MRLRGLFQSESAVQVGANDTLCGSVYPLLERDICHWDILQEFASAGGQTAPNPTGECDTGSGKISGQEKGGYRYGDRETLRRGQQCHWFKVLVRPFSILKLQLTRLPNKGKVWRGGAVLRIPTIHNFPSGFNARALSFNDLCEPTSSIQ